MSYDFHLLSHKGIQHLHPYVAGKSIAEVTKTQGISNIIKLAGNENALGCSPKVIEALQGLDATKIYQYPIYTHHPLFQELSAFLDIDSHMLSLANGSDALFGLLMICFALGQDKHILTHDYAFSSYAIQAQTLGIPVISTPMPNWTIDIDALLSACTEKTALIFIANPNNPTGGCIDFEDIQYILEHIPKTTLLVLDEAYYEYLPPQQETIQLLKKHRNMVITRTFSKAYGLAGLRLGYAISDPQISALLKKVHLPFAVNIAALTAASAALSDPSFIEHTRQTITNNREALRIQLDQHHLSYLPAFANFITIHLKKDCAETVLFLEQKGIIVRPLHPYGMNEYMRVTIGTVEQNQRFLQALLDQGESPNVQHLKHQTM